MSDLDLRLAMRNGTLTDRMAARHGLCAVMRMEASSGYGSGLGSGSGSGSGSGFGLGFGLGYGTGQGVAL